MSKVCVFIHDQVVTMVSAPSLRNRNRGSKLTKNAIFTEVLTWERAQVEASGVGVIEVITGYASSRKMTMRLEVIISGVGFIAATWICTKSFWFLRPTDELLSFRSPERALGSNQGGKN